MTTILALPALAQADPRYPDGDPASGEKRGDDGVALVAIVLDGAPEGMFDLLKQSVLAGLKRAGVRAVGFDAVWNATSAKPELRGCVSPLCLRELETLVDARRFLHITVSATGMNYTITAKVYESENETPVRNVRRPCPACNANDTATALSETVAVVVGPPPEMDVSITSEPSGAALFIDGEEAGVTPFNGKLRAGKHTIRASLEGYEAAESTIEVKEEAEGVQTFQLVLVIYRVEVPEVPTRPFKWLKWVGAGATLGALGAGGTWVYIHGDETCSDRETCPLVYETRNQGYITLGVGAALLGGTIYMFVRDARDVKRIRGVVVPTKGGAMAGFSGRF